MFPFRYSISSAVIALLSSTFFFSCKPETARVETVPAVNQVALSRLIRNSSVIFGGRLLKVSPDLLEKFKTIASEPSAGRQDSMVKQFIKTAPDSVLNQWRKVFVLADSSFLEAEKKESKAFARMASHPKMKQAIDFTQSNLPNGMKSYADGLSFEDRVRFIVLGYDCHNSANKERPVCLYEKNLKQAFISNFQQLEKDTSIVPFFNALREAQVAASRK
jgi:hypothetical protein